MLQVIIDLRDVVKNGDTIDKAIVEQLADVLLVFLPLKAVADDVGILSDFAFGIQAPHQGNIKGGGCLDVDIVFQGLIQHKTKM